MEKIKMQRNDDISVQEGFNKLIRMKKAKNLSPDSIRHYETHFKYFADFFNASQPCKVIPRGLCRIIRPKRRLLITPNRRILFSSDIICSAQRLSRAGKAATM
ncbi:MAG: hypothetical protein LBC86_06120 [Oscillospiraceae bacterium]|jgi:hypothetical protein|nr:hypothetical protein [Oscillospiraceae bacterium]